MVPIIVSAAAAACSLAFFRVWVVFTVDLGGPADLGLPGAALAREISGRLPWLYVTPAGLVVILLVSFVRLLGKSGSGRTIFGPTLVIVSVVLGVWPVHAIARITERLRATHGSPKMTLGAWWWVYCLGLAVIALIGLVDFALSIRASGRSKLNPAGRSSRDR
ncbi:MAG TPA: hypothetical protein VI756_13520 [Blastocatellia bacterium]